MHDLLVKGGRVIDPAQEIDGHLDIAIDGNKITAIGANISYQQGRRVIDVTGKIVTPGLIDMHCHVYAGIHKDSTEPDSAGVKQGVTTVVDGGSAGQAIFAGFPQYIIPSARTNVVCFLNLSSIGQALFPAPELKDWSEILADAIVSAVESNRAVIRGLKLRLVGNLVASEGVKVWEEAKKVAKRCGLPIMVHLGDNEKKISPETTRQILARMEPDDIISHFLTPRYGGCTFLDGRFYPELLDAVERGVVLDTADGKKNVSFSIARKAMSLGILPTTISTDLVKMSLNGPTYGLTVSMSKFLALGLDLKSIIKMTTINPARAIGLDHRLGSIKVGMDADLSILEMKSGCWELVDAEEEIIKAAQLLVPHCAVKSGEIIESHPIGQPKNLG
jgi:dihydroorotase